MSISSNMTCRPRQALQELSRKHTTLFKRIDELRRTRWIDLAEWPEYCFLPSVVYGELLVDTGWDDMSPEEFSSVSHHIRKMFALATWRVTQGIYRFDPDVYDALSFAPQNEMIPYELLLRLPEWCVYIETPGLNVEIGPEIHGVWVYVDAVASHSAYLVFVMDCDGECSFSIELKPGTLKEWAESNCRASTAFRNSNIDDVSDGGAAVSGYLTKILPLLLYITSTGAEIGDGTFVPTNPKPKRVKKGERFFPPNSITTWGVAVRMGAAIRKAGLSIAVGKSLGHQSPRGHIRCAHWHGFRSGPMKRKDGTDIPTSERRMEVRWMPPLAINLSDEQDLPSTIRPVL
jgi:hypothetical protein